MRSREKQRISIPQEAFGLRPITGTRFDKGDVGLRIGLGVMLGVGEWAMPVSYRALIFSRNQRIQEYAYPVQSLLLDVGALAGTVALAHYVQIPDVTHNPILHSVQNVLTFYGEKGLINNAVLYADIGIRKRRIRNNQRRMRTR